MRVQVGDIKMFFDVEGAKLRPDGPVMREVPTLLLLHGGPGGDHASFKPGYGTLTDIAQVIYLDHRGQGRSDASTSDAWRLARWADDVVAFCDALEVTKPVVLGLSFGGFVAAAYATRHPDHPGKLICAARAPAVPRRSAKRKFSSDWAARRRARRRADISAARRRPAISFANLSGYAVRSTRGFRGIPTRTHANSGSST